MCSSLKIISSTIILHCIKLNNFTPGLCHKLTFLAFNPRKPYSPDIELV